MPDLTPTNTDGRTCVGCHALSPNGDNLIASAGGQNDGRLLLWNVAANSAIQPFPLAQKSQFESWNSDGTQFVGVYGDSLPGRRGASDLVPAVLGKNRYYPAIAPDGNLVAYDESTCNGTPRAGQTPDVSCNADTDATATMYVTSVNGMAPVALANANRPGVADGATTSLTNSYPKWAPFIERLDETHKLVWLTFSSTRQYGLRSPPASTGDTTETRSGTLIWMVGVNPEGGGTDPSYTAFCLPSWARGRKAR